jgi:hypothetical protein|tara:strand:+ start:997 stop:1293 length:297 start_codon:yes stop_codon:yes gene_type:complete
MLKCADNEDIITMKADDAGDVVTFMFESPGTSVSFFSTLATKQRRHIPTRDRQIRDWFEKASPSRICVSSFSFLDSSILFSDVRLLAPHASIQRHLIP